MKPKASQIAATEDFIDDMIEFSSQSMQWCADESEKATLKISEVLHHLTNDARRISIMSAEAIALLKEFKKKAATIAASPTDGQRVSKLIKGLQELGQGDKDIHEFASPVVSALQFQDRTTQMMNNVKSMIAMWALMRQTWQDQTSLTAEDRKLFGEKLFECTSMASVRDIIRQHIPELPPEKAAEGTVLF